MSRTSLWLLRVSAPLAAATVLAQITYPLVSGRARDAVTVVTVLLFAAASLSHAAITMGRRAALGLLAVAGGGGLLVEAVGVHTGRPFGEYSYADSLGPMVVGVPAVIPLAWVMMAWPAYVVAARLVAGRGARILVGAWALASWDLFLDPQMVDAGHWTWADPTPALPGVGDVPLTNYAGWVLVSVLLMTALDAVLGGAEPRRGAVPTALYLWTYASSVLAHAAFFGLPGSAAWGALGMGAVAIPLSASLRRSARIPA